MDFEVKKNFDGASWQVELSGEIDIYNSVEMKDMLNQLIEENVADIHVDCSKLGYIDSTGLGALVGVLKRAKSHNKSIYLTNVKPNILKLFQITNLDKVFIIS